MAAATAKRQHSGTVLSGPIQGRRRRIGPEAHTHGRVRRARGRTSPPATGQQGPVLVPGLLAAGLLCARHHRVPAPVRAAPRRHHPRQLPQVRDHVAQRAGLPVLARNEHPPAGADHPFLWLNPHDCVPFIDEIFAAGEEAKLDLLPSPRLMNTHLPYTLLPDSVTKNNGCRVVYVCRDPKDMAVSLWHYMQRRLPDLSFVYIFDAVCDGALLCGPVWDHALTYWHASVARPDRVLFLKYDNLLRDPCGNVRRLAEFMGRPFSAAEEDASAVAAVVELCSFEVMKGLEVNKAGTVGLNFTMPRDSYFRKGVAGDWANHMSPEMAARLDGVVREKLQGTGLTFA